MLPVRQRIRVAEEPVVAALAAAGIHVGSVWDCDDLFDFLANPDLGSS